MLRVGLTGGIGSGKSTVAQRLAEHGAVVIDSDKIAREVVEPGTEGLAEVVATFGDDVLDEHGALNRAALAAKAFADEESRQRLNAIVHPRIGARTAELMAAASPEAIIVHDVPLLVEGNLAPAYHLVIVVDAPEEVRVRRLELRGLAESDARARIALQANESQRRAVADVWLDNAGSRDEVLSEVDKLWADRLVHYEANVRLHRRAPYGPPRLVDSDPAWPAQAQRLINRIKFVAGERARRIDHVGSTSVAGLLAKDVIDLQLTVSTMDDADALADALTEAGFPHIAGIDRDNPKPDRPDPAQWRKRVHAAADPGRPVNLHIREEGSGGWRFALLFPDWLRANLDEFADYVALKQKLVKQYLQDDDTERYAAGKEPWFDGAYERANAWAEQHGWQP